MPPSIPHPKAATHIAKAPNGWSQVPLIQPFGAVPLGNASAKQRVRRLRSAAAWLFALIRFTASDAA